MQTLLERLYENKPLMFAAALIAFLIAALLLLIIVRMLFGARLRMAGGRSRQVRLGIVDAFDLDRQRQLIIVRRDNTEHLIMIGGPNDLLIESEIVRVEAREQRDGRRDKVDVAQVPIGLADPRLPTPFPALDQAAMPSNPRAPAEPPLVAALEDIAVPAPLAMPAPLPPAIPASPAVASAEVPAPVPTPPPRAPTFPLPPRRPVAQPLAERRPSIPRAPERPLRTEPVAPSLDIPVSAASPPEAQASMTAPVAAPPAPPLRPAPPPFLKPLPPRPVPKILQRAVPAATPAAPVPSASNVDATPAPAAPPSDAEPIDTLESLEEEMAKLLGRGGDR